MRRGGILICCVVVIVAYAETTSRQAETVTIPLKNIWAHEMPGTRDVHELEKAALPANQAASLDNQIGDALLFVPKGKTTAKGFAVDGTEKEALSKALAAFVKKQQPRQAFAANTQVFVFFFSHSFGQYVHLDNVERREKTIKIAYRFVPHETKQLTAHYALIPLGKLPAGKYRVDIVRLPLEKSTLNKASNRPNRNGRVELYASRFLLRLLNDELGPIRSGQK